MKTISKFVLALVVLLMLASLSLAQEVRVRTNSNTRLREAPSTTAVILNTIPRGTVLVAEALTIDKGWIQVTYQGQTGWIATRLVNFLAPSTPSRASRPDRLVLDGNWTLEITGAFSCLGSIAQAVDVPNFRETVTVRALNRFTAVEITGNRFTQGRTVTMNVSGTNPLTYIGTFPFVLGGSASSAVEVTLVFGFEVINNRSMIGTLYNVTVKRDGEAFVCENGDYVATLNRNRQ
jgi:hypothetical protein